MIFKHYDAIYGCRDFKCGSIHPIRGSIHAIKVGIVNQNDTITFVFNKKLLIFFIKY